MTFRVLLVAVITWAIVCSSGCYAIAASKSLRRAEHAYGLAQSHPHRAKAPYHFRRATLFLKEARQAESRGEFEASEKYAKVSLKGSQSVLAQGESNAP